MTLSGSAFGATPAMISLVTSVMMPSAGVIRTLTKNAALTPAYAAAMPARGLRPRLAKAAAPSGISTR